MSQGGGSFCWYWLRIQYGGYFTASMITIPGGVTMDKEEKRKLLIQLESFYGEDGFVDVTERIECYERGKVWQCDCGQDIGTRLNRQEVLCAKCDRTNIDLEWSEREPNETADGVQLSLDNF